MYKNAFSGKTVLITGHTGFKGAWLAIYLRKLGAQVVGYSLEPPTSPSLFEQTQLADRINHIHADIRDTDQLKQMIIAYQPDFIFHMAAQALVLESYRNPLDTFDVNVMGSLSVLEALRLTSHPCVVVMVATDKCYENREWLYGYRETDALGGHDPYSASKGAMEIAVASYRLAFFPPEYAGDHGVYISSVRSGNVIGGGDWANFRIVPDAIKALSQGQPIGVRNPHAVRPWQHVLEPLSGYLWLAARMSMGDGAKFASAWNFGPLTTEGNSVRDLVETLIASWGAGEWIDRSDPNAQHEANLLRLCIDKAYAVLGWQPVWDFETTIRRTVAWYKAAQAATDSDSVYESCLADIAEYERAAEAKNLSWIS